MGNKIEADEFLKEYAKENPETTSSLAPDFARIESGAINRIKKPRTGLRIAVGIAAIFLIFAAGAFFTDSGIVRAYRQKALIFLGVATGEGTTEGTGGEAVVSNQPDIAAAQKKVSFHIPEPHWLPEGYAFESIKLTDSKTGLYRVVIKYTNGEKRVILTFENDTDSLTATTPSPDDLPAEEIDVQGTKVFLWEATGPTKSSLAVFISKDGLLTHVAAPLDKQGMLQLMLGLY